MATTVRSWLDFALLQSASESYLQKASDLTNDIEIKRILREGANNAQKQDKLANDPLLSSATRFTDKQAEWFTKNYEIVTQYPDDDQNPAVAANPAPFRVAA